VANDTNGEVLFRYYGNELSITRADATTDGYLSKEDWNRFNSGVTSVFGRAGDVVAQSADYAAFYQPLGNYEPGLGNPAANGYLLSSTAAGVRSWIVPPLTIVSGVFGRTGDILAQTEDYAAFYAPLAAAVPAGGATGQVLSKISATDYNTGWSSIVSSIEGLWNFSSTTTMADPGSGKVRVNNVSVPGATQMAISATTNAGTDRSQIIKSLTVGDQIVCQDRSDSANWVRYTVQSAPIDNTTWFQIAVSATSSSGTTSSNNNELVIAFEGGGGAGAAPVQSVFGRIGSVVAQTGDYSISQISGANPTNWDAAYADRMKWDGGGTGLVPATGRTSLGLGSSATHPATDFELALGNPSIDGQVLSSTAAGVRSWIAGGGADLVYNGDFPTNTPYTDGDIVIQGDVAYMCVRPTSTTPTAWPGGVSGGSGLPTGGTAAQVLSKNSATNYDASWATLSGATFQSATSNLTGTTSTAGVMVGLAYAITPVRTGKVVVSICGSLQNTVTAGQCLARIYYGTGTAPTNGAALTGTTVGGIAHSHSGGVGWRLPFNLTAVITGLTPGTPIWFDLSQSAVAASGTASVINVAGTAYELP
jgi:hypothetical protein